MQTPLQCTISILGRAEKGEGGGKEGHREKKKVSKTNSGDLFFSLLKMLSVFHLKFAGEYVVVWAMSLSQRKVKILFSSHWNISSWTKNKRC